ncbi:MAG: hypothetical protein P4L51_16210 [Puia sp.]|nr:hypothetical protein [Alphaproteobacteria bacterium]MDR3714362.1 hypothetical protein [Puia sp.]
MKRTTGFVLAFFLILPSLFMVTVPAYGQSAPSAQIVTNDAPYYMQQSGSAAYGGYAPAASTVVDDTPQYTPHYVPYSTPYYIRRPSAPFVQNTAQPDETYFAFQRSTETDRLDTETTTVSHEFKFINGAGGIGPVLQYSRFDQKDVGNANLYRPEISMDYKLNDRFSFSGVAGVDNYSVSYSNTHTIATYNVYGTYSPSKTLSIGLGSFRNTFGILQSMQEGIAATYFGGDINYAPTNTLHFSVSGNEGLYNDGNERQFGQLSGEKQVLSKPFALFLGARVTGMHFAHSPYNGYFDPERYGAAEGLLRIRANLTQKLSLDTGGSAGFEAVNPDYAPKPTYDPNIKLSYAIGNNVALEGTAEYYGSNLATDSGFSQLILGLDLHYFWR